jgi:hypothetical protein
MHALLLATVLALGVGATDASHIVVKIDGKDRIVDLKTGASGDGAHKFLQCLVAGRVLKLSAGKARLLDGNDVADHVREFVASKTSADPCALGKAVYTPKQ